ncbi:MULTISPECIES: hypothetical protein [Trichocoleus]|uniref:Uncharacterized protein n=1 Tax=Trichocoleus desertorum GB2-A4 TaxID=2933944 RepID=A0ABV0JC95_9CYAN|nr:hypothetical protein [Trichocoleus sp. FACHB-46]MBD1864063.1 hypothetical protein [Trichocoleus sp. FACHB-46]
MNQHPFDPSDSHLNGNNGSGQKMPPPTPIPPTPPLVEPETLPLVEPEAEQAKQERLRATQQSFKRLYLILLAVGLSIGAVLAVGVAILLDRFGLSDPPSRCNRNSIGCFQNAPPET